jgi:hypothetical protein
MRESGDPPNACELCEVCEEACASTTRLGLAVCAGCAECYDLDIAPLELEAERASSER